MSLACPLERLRPIPASWDLPGIGRFRAANTGADRVRQVLEAWRADPSFTVLAAKLEQILMESVALTGPLGSALSAAPSSRVCYRTSVLAKGQTTASIRWAEASPHDRVGKTRMSASGASPSGTARIHGFRNLREGLIVQPWGGKWRDGRAVPKN
jgi:hypothetical protein